MTAGILPGFIMLILLLASEASASEWTTKTVDISECHLQRGFQIGNEISYGIAAAQVGVAKTASVFYMLEAFNHQYQLRLRRDVKLRSSAEQGDSCDYNAFEAGSPPKPGLRRKRDCDNSPHQVSSYTSPNMDLIKSKVDAWTPHTRHIIDSEDSSKKDKHFDDCNSDSNRSAKRNRSAHDTDDVTDDVTDTCLYVGLVYSYDRDSDQTPGSKTQHGTYAIFDSCANRACFIINGYLYELKPSHKFQSDKFLLTRTFENGTDRCSLTAGDSAQNGETNENGKSLTNAKYLSTIYTRQNRVKRHLFTPTYVQIAVFTDETMREFHEDDLPYYINTLMRGVAMTYTDASIGVYIDIAYVAHINIDNQKTEITQAKSAETTLMNFCEWQTQYNPIDEEGYSRYDVALLLTRRNICKANGDCATIGLTHLDVMCNRDHSCAIVQDTGLSSSLSIAHELAHLFGVVHDGDLRCVELNLVEHRIMEKVMQAKGIEKLWSDCSRHFFKEKLRVKPDSLRCLRNRPLTRLIPADDVRSFSRAAEGFRYTMDDQCRKAHGHEYQACNFYTGPKCGSLYCQKSKQIFCTSNQMPVADGTPCGESRNNSCSVKRCVHGQCTCWNERAPIHGGWGPWGQFGPCSRPCDGGIQKRYRTCSNPEPANGGRYCTGSEVNMMTCNTHKCPPHVSGYREDQCSVFDGDVRGLMNISENVIWVPKFDVSEPYRCQLVCKVLDDRLERSVVLRNSVEDGTRCGPDEDNHDICISGNCVKVGCDNFYDSEQSTRPLKTYDICGVCDGNNITCKLISRKFRIVDHGVKFITEIPQNAANIYVNQESPAHEKMDSNHLILKDSTGHHSVVNDESSYALGPRVINHKSIKVEYSGVDAQNEWIRIPQKLKSPLKLYVNRRDTAEMVIDVEYWLDTRVPRISRYARIKKQVYPTPCSSVCNGERKVQRKVCKDDLEDETSRHSIESCPDSAIVVEATERCNLNCSLSWYEDIPVLCSTRCGLGYRGAKFLCRMDNDSGHWRYVDDQYCISSIGVKPKLIRQCIGDCSGGGWQFSKWQACQGVAGMCTRRREAFCVDMHGSTTNESNCNSEFKITEEFCEGAECETPKWMVSDWNKCDCKVRRKRRDVWCHVGGQLVDDPRCAKRKPDRKSYCQCKEGRWSYGKWSKCDCLVGRKTRPHWCKEGNKTLPKYRCNKLELVSLKNCPAECNPAIWVVGQWSQCNCMTGTKHRKIWCQRADNIVDDDHCPPKPPSTMELCQQECKKPDWKFGMWGQCDCSIFEKHRIVSCVDDANNVQPDWSCMGMKPSKVAYCNDGCTIGQWRTGDWSECNSYCGEGNRSRLVMCIRQGGYTDDKFCDVASKPATNDQCTNRPCFDWVSGGWGPCRPPICSKVGTRHLTIRCINVVNNTEVDEVMCQTPKDTYSQPCLPDCVPRHRENSYELEKPVTRTTSNRESVQSGLVPREGRWQSFPGSSFPADIESVPVPKCTTEPTQPRWRITKWSPCSSYCGEGYRYRNVLCYQQQCSEGVRLPERMCSQIHQPKSRDFCSSHGTCDKRRCHYVCSRVPELIMCRHNRYHSSGVASIQTCRRKPNITAKCHSMCSTLNGTSLLHYLSNISNFYWRAASWSECSATCGAGNSQRIAVCMSLSHQRAVEDSRCIKHLKPITVKPCWRNCTTKWTDEPADDRIQNHDSRDRKCALFGEDRKFIKLVSPSECVKRQTRLSRRLSKRQYAWFTGAWTQCINECDSGYQTRVVECIDSNHKMVANISACPQTSIPVYRRQCQPATHASSCEILRDERNCQKNGEYKLIIGGNIRKIYCHNMKFGPAREYLTFRSAPIKNYAEIFSNGYPFSHDQSPYPECRQDGGFTVFSKIRIHPVLLEVELTDFTFAETRYGRPIPYATAGHCDRLLRCKQGRASIDLTGTGFMINPATQWIGLNMNQFTSPEYPINEGVSLYSSCETVCYRCKPSRNTGLILRPDISQHQTSLPP